MSAVLEKAVVNEYGLSRFVLKFRPFLNMNDEKFFKFAQANRDVRMEQNKYGEIIIMPPTGSETGDENAEITMQLRIWAKQDKTGKTYDSSSGFKLPNGATRSPDASWVAKIRLEKFTASQRRKFLPICPDFVIELWSPSDKPKDLQDKMNEYLENGARLGWLINPKKKQVHIYRPGKRHKIVENPSTVSGEDVLPGFELDMTEIW